MTTDGERNKYKKGRRKAVVGGIRERREGKFGEKMEIGLLLEPFDGFRFTLAAPATSTAPAIATILFLLVTTTDLLQASCILFQSSKWKNTTATTTTTTTTTSRAGGEAVSTLIGATTTTASSCIAKERF